MQNEWRTEDPRIAQNISAFIESLLVPYTLTKTFAQREGDEIAIWKFDVNTNLLDHALDEAVHEGRIRVHEPH